jgi:hypothetical protein
MAVKKKQKPTTTKTPEPVATSKTQQATDKAAAKKTTTKKKPVKQAPAPSSPTETTEHKQKVASGKSTPKPKSGEDVKLQSMKPALDAKRAQDAKIRSEQLLETGLLVIDPKDAQIPLEAEPINASLKDEPEGIVEIQVAGTHLRLLGLANPNATPTLAQRLSIARRLLEVGPKLPKYVKTIEQKKPDFSNAEIKVKRGEEKVEGAPKNTPAAATGGNGKTSASTLENGVPLKKICADINIDPKLARRILRSKGKKPGGRWEWEQKEVDSIKTLLTTEAKKLAEAGKE